jgi:hypothetical protein
MQNCLNKGPSPLQREYNKNAKKRVESFKIFSRRTEPENLSLTRKLPGIVQIQVC